MAEERIILPGSEKHPRMDATIRERADAGQRVQVTIVRKKDDRDSEGAIHAFASNHGLEVQIEHGLVKLSGSVAWMEQAFGVELFVAVTETGEHFRSRVPPGELPASILIPAHLEPYVLAVLGLDDRPVAQPHFRIHQRNGIIWHPAAKPQYTAAQVGQIYNFPPGDGSGRSVAIIELGGGFSASDCQSAGIDPSLVVAVGVDGARNSYTGNPNSADGEVALDIQVVGGVAPKCKQYVLFAPNSDAGFVDAVAAALHMSQRPDAISISWGAPENQWTAQARNAMESVFAQCVAAGIPCFAASGDNGSKDGTSSNVADFPASAPHATGCGGTQLTSSSETVWNDAGGGATGGGISQAFAAPAYQTGLGLRTRGVPDVSGDAAPGTGYSVVIGGRSMQFGGTSAVAPLWSGLSALLVAALGKPLGDLNSKIYPLVGKAIMRDITSGNNGSYQAQPGYDLCTGCGSPDGQKLLAALGGTTPPPPDPPPGPPPITIKTIAAVATVLTYSDGSTKTVQVAP